MDPTYKLELSVPHPFRVFCGMDGKITTVLQGLDQESLSRDSFKMQRIHRILTEYLGNPFATQIKQGPQSIQRRTELFSVSFRAGTATKLDSKVISSTPQPIFSGNCRMELRDLQCKI